MIFAVRKLAVEYGKIEGNSSQIVSYLNEYDSYCPQLAKKL
ncbi:hypothetical protein CNEO4_1780003 [Clostridium neonatale]|nr:hypothetical protein CNEO3_1300005 [Clostridium neonatale]CAI3603655.1 hypothetical protein CNEO4_1900002 [Clostridium neonatale]CAI3612654.1 hypothetical protein CNEO4_1780003 [Clostridium neonatale]CAI3629774.1 hypothetical protein CNEO4_1840004 [Clostridium neonatale]CAI4138782.1 hypothetical protein CNEO4_1500004 [Clostridium neonatale]